MSDIKEVVITAYKIKQKIKTLEAKYNDYRGKIQKHFDSHMTDTTSLKIGPVIASRREKIIIQYYPNKLKKKLDKKLFKKVTETEYVVKDINQLIKLLKKAGVKPASFKKLIEARTEVNAVAIKNAFEVGKITQKDLKGCYSAKVIKYIDIRGEK